RPRERHRQPACGERARAGRARDGLGGGLRMTMLFHGARKLDADGQVDDFWMLVDGDSITETGSGRPPEPANGVERIEVGGDWLVPGFVDLHCHGGGGHSYDDDAVEIGAALATHRAHGTTRSV